MSDADDELKFILSKESEGELKKMFGPSFRAPIEKADAATCEDAAFLLCTPADLAPSFDDNKMGACSICNAPVFYRPYAPTKPPKVCLRCLPAFMKKAGRA